MAKLRVLIADDNDDMRHRLVVLLCRNYQVVGAVTIRELVQVATCLQPDVIVSDISTPRMEGLAARKKLIAEGRFIPFVFVSRDSKEIVNLLWKEKSVAVVCKDETSMHLVNAVESAHNLAIYDSPFYPDLLDQYENQNVVVIAEETLRKAEQLILSCEGCSSEADLPFSEILDLLTGSAADVTDYILNKPGSCPRCFRVITETTYVEVIVRE